MNKDKWLKRIRNYAGLLGGILPWLSLLGAYIYGDSTGLLPVLFWKELSISATYYVTPALAAVLTAASLVLMCYDGYDRQDSIVTTLSGVFGILVVVFPCSCAVSPPCTGFFQLPSDISNAVHVISAAAFFCLLAYNDIFLFTKTDDFDGMTDRKKTRNIVYRVCGVGMLVAMILLVVPVDFPAKIWQMETVALTFFACSWLTKGGAFPFLNDRK